MRNCRIDGGQLTTQRLLRGFLIPWLLLLGGCGDAQDGPPLDLSVPATAAEIQVATAEPEKARQLVRFGFALRNGPKEDALQYLPLLRYLQRTTGIGFSLRFTDGAHQLLADLASGRLQFAAFGPATYFKALRNAPILPLARGVDATGEAGCRAILVVPPDSPLQRVQDLKGKRLAFGSISSTRGHWIPRIMLHQADLGLQDLGSYIYTGSHRDCAESVITGRADACGLQDTLALHLLAEGSLRQLAASDLYPSRGIFVHAGVPVEIRRAVRKALVEFDPQGRDRAGLYHWEVTEMAGGFVAANEDDYEPLRFRAEQLGLLGAAPASGEAP